jgi:hypothetical protein
MQSVRRHRLLPDGTLQWFSFKAFAGGYVTTVSRSIQSRDRFLPRFPDKQLFAGQVDAVLKKIRQNFAQQLSDRIL